MQNNVKYVSIHIPVFSCRTHTHSDMGVLLALPPLLALARNYITYKRRIQGYGWCVPEVLGIKGPFPTYIYFIVVYVHIYFVLRLPTSQFPYPTQLTNNRERYGRCTPIKIIIYRSLDR